MSKDAESSTSTDELRKSLEKNTDLTPALRFGTLVLILIVIAAGFGAAYLKFDGAAVAAGNMMARGQNQIVQHLEGGIVSEILVDEGEEIKAGDVIVRLDTTQATSDLRTYIAEMNSTAARLAAFHAEREGETGITYPAWLLDTAKRDAEVASLMQDQDHEFQARLEASTAQAGTLRSRIEAAKAELEGYEVQLRSFEEQKALTVAELADVETLYSKQLVGASRVYDVRGQLAELDGRVGQAHSKIGEIEQRILGFQQEIFALEKDRVELAAEQVVTFRLEMLKLAAAIEETRDVIRRSTVRAPVDAVIVRRAVNTIGGVLGSGGEVVELLPQPADLVAEVRVSVGDIDRIYLGQDAFVRLSALDIPFAPLLDGKVEYIAADRAVDEISGEEYYPVRISNIQVPEDIGDNRLYSGMQVEAFIKTGERTFAQYVFEPLKRSFERSLRER
ncbi:Type I secretion system membrane fusion protein PrsE [Falsiruegeria litorea R37]|uniref:Membrane fusion protein (MFP) family protein n=1 Tax=Falsiruegeria litorea R37 TaxID=1200284 RepID=A0A1Y5TF91_9RHOB|nr:HlyD family type I secretion periplasmic adaptor subunit [Falsiruegeria litorea]SLN58971.1 Type I secretion system membrane fusion protein PrsE [Falsiruegeria litorea R37]